jgi:carboxymethylenebutenolidase
MATSDVKIAAGTDAVPVHLATPRGTGPWPGVVVIHDALGMTTDLRNQAGWLADAGYLAAAPDLYHRSGRLRCMFATIRAAARRSGPAFDDLDAVRSWVAVREDCTGRVGVIGFCMGGGFALLLAAGRGYDASSVNYGVVPDDVGDLLRRGCPIVGSFGARDRSMGDAPRRLSQALTANGVDHDVVTYPHAGHSFLNDHDPADVPRWALIAGALTRSEYHEPSARDARRRIVAFFDAHLRD